MENRNRLKNMILQPGVFAWVPALAFLIIFISHSVGFGASNQSIVYQGRIQRPDGSVPNTGSITFSLAVYSPAPKKCLLYSETQSVSMAGSGGMFNLALGMGSRNDSGVHTFDQIFVNGGSLSGLNCADGSTSYAPAATDDRNIIASFNDNGTVVNLSAMEIKSIPFALQAHQIGGYGINDIIKVHPTTGSATTFTTAEMVRVRALGGATCASNEILKWNGITWICSTDNTGGSPGDAGYGSSNKGIVAFDTNAATSGVTVASGVAKLLDVLSTPGSFGSATQTVSVTVNAHGRITAISEADIALPPDQITQSGATNGQVLKWNGTEWAPDDDEGTTTDASYSAKGIVQFDTDAVTSGVSVTAGVAKVNTGTGAGQILKLDGSAKLPAVDGSSLTNLSAGYLSGTIPVGNGGTGLSTYTTGDLLYASGASAISKLGIGVNGTVLTSNGSSPVWGTVDSLGFFKDGGNTFTATATVGTNSNHNLAFKTNGTTKMTIEAGGDVGIGIANPSAVLEVGGTSRALTNSQALVNFFSTDTQGADIGATLGLGGQDGVTSRTFATIGGLKENGNSGDFGGYLAFATRPNGSLLVERMRIDSGGNVGIGKVPSGTSKFEVQGPGGSTGSLVKLIRSSGNSNQFMEIHPGDVANSHHYITSQSYESFKKKTVFSSVHDGSGTPTGELGYVFRTGPASAPVEIFSILESGYTGIGSGTPTSILDINGAFTQRGMAAPTTAPAGQGRIYFDSTSNKFRISQNGGAYVDLVPVGVSDASYASKGAVQGLTDAATSGLVFNSGVINVNTGTGANQIVKLDGSGKLPALDGSALTGITASNIGAGVLPIARGGTNNGALSVTDGGIVYADGTSLQTTTAGTTGQAFISQGTGIPTWGTLGVAGGGTGLTTGTSGGIPYFSAASTMASSAALIANGVVLGGGAGAAPTATAAGSAHSVLRVPSGGGAPVFGAIDLSQSAAVSGSLGIGNGGTGASSLAANRLIGTNGTGTAQQVVTCSLNQVISFDASGNYGCYTVSSLTEKSVTFTPTTVGWYRILNGNNAMNLGGMIRIAADQYDNRITDVELQFNIGGYSTSGSIQQTRFASYNYGVVDRARVSSDGAGSVYLDIYISSATAPGPVTVFAFGPRVGTLVAAPVVGAVAGSTDVKVLNLGHGFRTTHGVQVGDDSGACDAAAAGTFRYTTDNAMEFCNGSNWKIVFVNGGSTYTGAAVLGANSNHNLEFETNGSTRMTIDNTGKVGIGVTGPTAKLEVQGQIVSKENIVTSGATANFTTGNTQILQSIGGSTITLDNMVNGGQYTVIVEDATARTYSFGNCTTTRAVPALATTTGRSVFTILKTSTACYITWITGF